MSWPVSWVGDWFAPDGKVVTVEREAGEVLVTVRPSVGGPAYFSAELLGGGTKLIERLAASCHVGTKGHHFLEVEAGTDGLGPTYRLYGLIETREGWRPATNDDAAAEVVLVPNTFIGMYDDWDDDLGVPWAYPLLPFRRQRPAFERDER